MRDQTRSTAPTRALLGRTFPAAARMLAAGFCLVMLLAGCTVDGTVGDITEATGEQSEGQAEVLVRPEPKPTINLAVTDWTGARLNTAIAERIIELRLGYPVEVIESIDSGEMIGQLRSGELDAALEIWPSTLEPEAAEMIAPGLVENLGELGVVGKVGWYVPRFVIEADPSLGAWQGYDNSAVAARFATDLTGERGRFLGTTPNYEQADAEIIEALGLPFDVVYSGSEEDTAFAVEQAIRTEEPVILFWWTPTAEVTRFDLVEVALPPRTPACEAAIASGSPQSCDYQPDQLFKIGSPALSEKAPDVHRFLTNFELTTADHLDLIDQVENQGKSLGVVADEWIATHSSKWNTWLE